MNHDDANPHAHRIADWVTDYHRTLRDRPVRAQTPPGWLKDQLPAQAPETPEPMETILGDFERLIPPHLTHWQHPRFFAFFPANAAPASMLAEQLISGLAVQGMLWETAPAAAELEEVTLDWLRGAMGLPDGFRGTIHDSATTATFSAVVSMRERATDWRGNEDGLAGGPALRIYASAQCHSSIDKAVRLAGIGQRNLVKVPVRDDLSMDETALADLIAQDRAAGHVPAGVILCTGGTSVGAMDRVGDAARVAKDAGLPVHLDAAWAGSAMICPEFRHFWQGAELCDSIVFNPHKWLGAQFDCAVQFLADPDPQIRALALRPDYIPAADRPVANFSEWTVPLGRRFRALKLWFLLRAEGLEALRSRIRNHVAWAAEAAEAIAALPGCSIEAGPVLGLFAFHYKDDARTEALLKAINDDGRAYLSQTRHGGKFLIRVSVGQFDCTRDDVMMLPKLVEELSATL